MYISNLCPPFSSSPTKNSQPKPTRQKNAFPFRSFHCSLAAEKITLTLDCRASILGSLIAVRCAQEALPNVDIPHITNRQIVAVSHANEYLFTDIVNSDRYQHTKCVLDAYQHSLSESLTWLYDMFNNTLKKDLDNAKNETNAVALKLREIRAHNIQMKSGYRPNEAMEQGRPFHITDSNHQ